MGNPLLFFMFNPVAAWWLTMMATPMIVASAFVPTATRSSRKLRQSS